MEEGVRDEAIDEAIGEGPRQTEAASEVQKLQEERDSLYDRLLRKQAEFENYKKRVDRERSEYIQFASADLIRELLNALDSFDLAIRNAGSDASANQNIIQGFSLTELLFYCAFTIDRFRFCNYIDKPFFYVLYKCGKPVESM